MIECQGHMMFDKLIIQLEKRFQALDNRNYEDYVKGTY